MADDNTIGIRTEVDGSGIKKGAQQYKREVDGMAKATEGFTRDANGRLRDANGRFVTLGDSATKAGGGIKSFGLSLSGLSLPSVTTGLGNVGAGILSIGTTAAAVAAGGVAALGAGLIGIAASGVKAAADVDHQMAQIAATLGTTKDAAMPLKDLMGELALDPGLTVNVTQAGEAIEVLAANGLNLQQIMDGAAKGTVELANAAGADFGTAATIATDAMAQFNIEAQNLSTVADGIAGVLVQSKFDADDYALALSNAGGIAGSLGVEFTDFNTVLTATANQFSSGADAGTSFKTLLTRLADPTDEVKAAMAEYGLSIYDAEGNLKSFAEIAGQLNRVFNESVTLTSQVGGATKEQAKAAEQASEKIGDLTRDLDLQKRTLKDLTDEYNLQLTYYDRESPMMKDRARALEKLTNKITDQEEKLAEYQAAIAAVDGAQARTITTTKKLTEEEKARLATILGGTDAMRTVLGLAELTQEEFEALSGEVNEQGLAAESAATRVDSLKGAWEIFTGIIEALQLQIGDAFLPVVRRMTEGFSEFASTYGPMVVGVFENIGTGIDKVARAFSKFGVRGAAVSILGQLGFDTGMVSEAENIINEIKTLWGSLFGSGGLGDLGTAVSALTLGEMLGLSPETSQMVAQFILNIKSLGTEIAGLYDAFSSGGVIGLAQKLGFGPDTLKMIFDVKNQIRDFMASLGLDDLKGALMGVGAVIATLVGGGLIAGLVAGLMSILTPINLLIAGAALLGAAWAGNWGNIQGITQQAVGYLMTAFNAISTVVMSVVNVIATTVWPQLSQAFSNITAALNNMGLTWGDIWNALGQAVTIVGGIIGVAVLTIIGVVTSLVGGFASAFATVSGYAIEFQTAFAHIFNGLTTIITGAVQVITGMVTGDLGLMLEGFSNQAIGVFELFGGAVELSLTTVKSALGGLLSFAGGFVNTFLGYFSGLGSLVGENFANIVTEAKDIMRPEIWDEVGTGIITGVIEGIERNMGQVLEILKQMAADALSGVMDMLGIQSPSTVFAEIGANIIQGLVAGVDGEGDTVQNAIARTLDFSAGMFGGFDALERDERLNAETAINNAFGSLYQRIIDGTAGVGDLMTEFRNNLSNTLFDEQEMREATRAIDFQAIVDTIRQQVGPLTVELKAQAVSLAQSFSGIAMGFADMFKQQIGSVEESMKVYEDWEKETEKLTKDYDKQKKELTGLNEKLAKATAQYGKGSDEVATLTNDISKLTQEMEANQKALDDVSVKGIEQMNKVLTDPSDFKITDQIAALQQFLDSGEESIKIMGEELGGVFAGSGVQSYVYWDRVSAQETLNGLLEEQARKEEEIRKAQEAQQQLAFLQQQIGLMKMIADQGLNPADVLGGITLGLNASVDDLLSATNNVVAAMIDQINADLQIASPSKVMAKIGGQVTAGLVQGLDRGKSLLERAGGMVSGALTGGVSGGVNNYYSSTTNTNVQMTMPGAPQGGGAYYQAFMFKQALSQQMPRI